MIDIMGIMTLMRLCLDIQITELLVKCNHDFGSPSGFGPGIFRADLNISSKGTSVKQSTRMVPDAKSNFALSIFRVKDSVDRKTASLKVFHN